MSHWRRFGYSISIAVVFTTLAYLFYPGVGEFLAVPGMIFQGWVNILILSLSKAEYPFQFYNWIGFSILFYAALSHLALWLRTLIKGAGAEVAVK